jgi:hypothetical protein
MPARIEARHRQSGVSVTVRVNTIWHDRARVWPIADRDRFEDSPDPHEIHVLVRLNELGVDPRAEGERCPAHKQARDHAGL